ncbi:hypothetical protein RB593_001548 [Gaeumannomyces tritici]
MALEGMHGSCVFVFSYLSCPFSCPLSYPLLFFSTPLYCSSGPSPAQTSNKPRLENSGVGDGLRTNAYPAGPHHRHQSSLQGMLHAGTPVMEEDTRAQADIRMRHILQHCEAAANQQPQQGYNHPALVRLTHDYARSDDSKSLFLSSFFEHLDLPLAGNVDSDVDFSDPEVKARLCKSVDAFAEYSNATKVRSSRRVPQISECHTRTRPLVNRRACQPNNASNPFKLLGTVYIGHFYFLLTGARIVSGLAAGATSPTSRRRPPFRTPLIAHFLL